MRNYAILIDAGFLKRKLGSQRAPMTAQHVADFIARLRQHPDLAGLCLHRIYYYDAPPLEQTLKRPLAGSSMNLGDTDLSRRNKSLLAKLATFPFFALRLGELHFRGWHIKGGTLPDTEPSVTLKASDLQPNIQQKGVDMRIGLDIAALTLKKQVSVIVLVTGDSDFVPAMKFARREGAQLFLVTLGHDVKDALIHHADQVIDIRPDDIV